MLAAAALLAALTCAGSADDSRGASIMFFDSHWLAAAPVGLDFRMGKAELLSTMVDPSAFIGWGYPSVWQLPDGSWRSVYQGWWLKDGKYQSDKLMLMAESRDAITWRPATLQRSAHAAVPNAVLNDAGNEFSFVYDDAAHVAAGSSERLKCLWGNATVSVSADGVTWRPFCKWSSKGVDPGTSVFRNPLDTDEIVITARPQEMRRAGRHMGTHAARSWAALGLAENSQMLPLDETYSVYDQQYGLPSFAYGGMVVSWFWRYRCPGVHGQCFSGGYVSVAMGYSYNSRNWTAFGQQLGGGASAA